MSSPSDLPSSREFVTKLLNSINKLPHHAADVTATTPLTTTSPASAGASNPLTHASESVKKNLMTLQALFPNELLPALDLLDRRLVTRFHVQRPEAVTAGTAAHPNGTSTVPPSLETHPKHGPPPHLTHPNQTETQDQKKPPSVLDPAPASPPPPSTIYPDLTTTTSPGQTHAPDTGPQAPGTSAQAIGPSSPIAPSYQSSENVVSTVALTAPATSPRTHLRTTRPKPDIAPDPLRREQRSGAEIVYYVRSAQHRSSRFSTAYESNTSYEVRLRAWNCSCPAFAFSAFPSAWNADAERSSGEHDVWHANDAEWSFGGLSRDDGWIGSSAPVCKHLLACVLAEKCEALFGEFVVDRVVAPDEAAGWAAGWGD